ncbi:hypothetical protein HDV00_008667 [Rhizophlyctis rosea]|nr:hypothetical protein HDV00_008667 [Rhizophlyctis rosea]
MPFDGHMLPHALCALQSTHLKGVGEEADADRTPVDEAGLANRKEGQGDAVKQLGKNW